MGTLDGVVPLSLVMNELIPIAKIVRATYNPRVMPDSEMEALTRSLTTFGFVEPVVVNKRENPFSKNDTLEPPYYYILVGGHQRTTATERLIVNGKPPKGVEQVNGEWCVPAMVVELNDEEERALNLALNKIRGRWDEKKLGDIIVGLRDATVLPATGFREDEISRILDHSLPDSVDAGGSEEGEPKEPRSKPGEVYQLGPHRLICGDSTDPHVLDTLLNGAKAAMIWTDPPYNVAYKSTGGGLAKEGKQSIKNDDMEPEDFKKLVEGAFAAMYEETEPGGAIYICTGWRSYPQFLDSMLKLGFHHSCVIVWVKSGGGFDHRDYKLRTEWIAKAKKVEGKAAEAIIYGWKKGTHHFFGDDNEYDVWDMPRKATQSYLHPTEKPDWLPMRAIRNSSKRGEIILDPFAGSGSVMAAAHKTGRSAYMVELDPKFCDVIRDRWERIEKAEQAQHEEA